MKRSLREKRCKVCSAVFLPWRSTQTTCSPQCAIEEVRRKQVRKDLRVARERLKTIGQLLAETQAVFNAFIRERDKAQGCISCHMPATYRGQWQASHYRTTRAAPELRFHEDNVHKSCAQCNGVKSGNIVEYRIRLIERIGRERLEWLEGPHEPKRYRPEDLRAIKAEYRLKLRELRASNQLAAGGAPRRA